MLLASVSSTSEGGLFDVKRWASGVEKGIKGLFVVRLSSFENIVECRVYAYSLKRIQICLRLRPYIDPQILNS